MLGQNNIWADAGQIIITDQAYLTTLKEQIQTKSNLSIIGPHELEYIATKNYSSGDFIIANNKLYTASFAISTGDILNPNSGGNITETNILEQIQLLKTSLS